MRREKGAAMKERYACAKRPLRIFHYLVKRNIAGATNKELAEALQTSAVNISRGLKVLEEEGMVAKQANGNWILTSVAIDMLQTYIVGLQREKSKLDEVNRNILGLGRPITG